ncbi:MAG: hypothetical protein IPG39_16315 [Bacteroidetes bacterium]|nr:hypothetical protein [Bacteroidota bacterium]
MDKDILYGLRIDKALGLIFELISVTNHSERALRAELIKSIEHGKIKLTDKDGSRGEYYIIENNGNISVYDKQGYVFTLRMLKYHGF